MKKTNGSFYDQLYCCADNLANRQIVMEDRENNKFMILNIVQTALYDNGKFTIKYNADLEKYLYGLQQNFTKLSLPVVRRCDGKGGKPVPHYFLPVGTETGFGRRKFQL